MISVGIDVSKNRSTVCILKPYGEILMKPFEIEHSSKDLEYLSSIISNLNDEIKVVMEATGIYHVPVLKYLQEKGIFVSLVNPYEMKKYRTQGLRSVKTDKQDSIAISNFGIDNWFKLKKYEICSEIYEELKFLGRRYRHYMKLRITSMQDLTYLTDQTMPKIKILIKGWNEKNGKDKLADFVQEYWHYDNITKKTSKQFINSYSKWSKKMGYYQNENKAVTIYEIAKKSITTLSSEKSSVKTILQESCRILQEINNTLFTILVQMQELAKSLPEYTVVRSMGGVGDRIAPKLIAEIGDIRRFHSAKALIAYTGIDSPPYQSGNYIGLKRKISKRGSSNLRKIGFEAMRSLKNHKPPEDRAVYDFILKKESEGKAKKVSKIAGLNKFLRIYYARVTEVYQK